MNTTSNNNKKKNNNNNWNLRRRRTTSPIECFSLRYYCRRHWKSLCFYLSLGAVLVLRLSSQPPSGVSSSVQTYYLNSNNNHNDINNNDNDQPATKVIVPATTINTTKSSANSLRIGRGDDDVTLEKTTSNSTTTATTATAAPLVNLNNNNNNNNYNRFTYFTNKPECHPLQPDEASVTLTTQLSMDRLWIMKYQCQHWPPPLPISIAIFLTTDGNNNNATTTKESYVLDLLGNSFDCHLDRMNISFLYGDENDISAYPVNRLRNLAIDGVSTTHAAYIDSDFLISQGLHNPILKSIQQVAHDPKAAIVIPAFEYQSNCTSETSFQGDVVSCMEHQWSMIPKTRDDIVRLLQNVHRPKVKRGYQNSKNGKNRYHSTTLYKEWIEAAAAAEENHQEDDDDTASAKIWKIPCRRSNTYEPYLIVRVCNQLPEFPTVFTGYGWNKMIWVIMLTHKLGYTLWQIPNGFVVHLPHEHSKSRTAKEEFKKNTDNNNGASEPPEQAAYLEWFWTQNPDHPNKPPACWEDSYKKKKKVAAEAKKTQKHKKRLTRRENK